MSAPTAGDRAGHPFAAFPMYDWPEVQWAVDELWHGVARVLALQGVAAPDGLTRIDDIRAQWVDPDLFMGQTCGLPYALELRPHATVLGAMTYDVGGLGPGHYSSSIVCRIDSAIRSIEDMRGTVVAFNNHDSQSGKGTMMQLLAPHAIGGRFFADAIETGSHRVSVHAVANGDVDVSAIDTISLALAADHDPDAVAELRVIHVTNPSPGTPFITSHRNAHLVPLMRSALARAVADLSSTARSALHLVGFETFEDTDYDVIADRHSVALELGYTDLR